MALDLDLDTLGLIVVFVLPGFVSMQVYRLLMPAREFAWTEATLQAFFYSSVNFALLFPAIYSLAPVAASGWFWNWFLVLLVVFVGPVVWPIVLVRLFRSDRIATWLKIPYPSTWDYFFDDGRHAFLLIHLNSGEVIGGLWSKQSRAGQYPRDGDLYLETLYETEEDGTFGAPIPYTKGLLIRSGQYTHIEVFESPIPNDAHHA